MGVAFSRHSTKQRANHVNGAKWLFGLGLGTFVSQGTLDTIDQSRRARLNGRAELFRELRRKTMRTPRADKEAYVRGI